MAIYLQIQTDRTELTYVEAKGSNCPNCGANEHKNNKCAYCGTTSGIITYQSNDISEEEKERIKIAFEKNYSASIFRNPVMVLTPPNNIIFK